MKKWFGKDEYDHSVSECNTSWDGVSKILKSLSFDNNGQVIELPDNMQYIQGKTASASLSGGKATIISRYIGFVLGNNIVKIRVDEKSNNIKVEVTQNDFAPEKPSN